jgi:hypothetical protein
MIIAPEALLFVDFDADRDLKVTFDELQLGLDAAWKAISAGRATTGYLEVQDWITAQTGSNGFPIAIMTFDPNYDAGISEEEFKSEVRRRFLERDSNLDKAITRDEFIDLIDQRTRAPVAPARRDDPAGEGRGRAPRR